MNGETRVEKNDWRDGLQNVMYTLLVSPTFFCRSRQFYDKCIAGFTIFKSSEDITQSFIIFVIIFDTIDFFL